VRDLMRRRQYMVRLRTVLKNKVHAEIATRWVKHDGDLFTKSTEVRILLFSHTETAYSSKSGV
jgi:hypothetical protein